MVTHYDEKGKFFTPVISKKPVMVIIQTVNHRVTGTMHIRPDDRINDELDRDEVFLAVTDATILDTEGKEIATSRFLSINRRQIVWVLPVEELSTAQKL